MTSAADPPTRLAFRRIRLALKNGSAGTQTDSANTQMIDVTATTPTRQVDRLAAGEAEPPADPASWDCLTQGGRSWLLGDGRLAFSLVSAGITDS